MSVIKIKRRPCPFCKGKRKVYILIGMIPYSVDNEVDILGVYDTEKKAEKGWKDYNGHMEDYTIAEWNIE